MALSPRDEPACGVVRVVTSNLHLLAVLELCLSIEKTLQCVGSCLREKSFCPVVIRQSSSLLLKHD